jgi:hypothetical protein
MVEEMNSLTSQRDKAWMYVGRFMWAFAGIEAAIDNIFEIMFNLNAVSFLLLQSNLDLRKKLKLLELGFKHQGIDHQKALKEVHQLANLRNAIVHSSFEPTFDNEGIQFSYINSSGEMKLPSKSKGKRPKGEEEGDESFISFRRFDELYDMSVALTKELGSELINFFALTIRS